MTAHTLKIDRSARVVFVSECASCGHVHHGFSSRGEPCEGCGCDVFYEDRRRRPTNREFVLAYAEASR